MFGSVVAGGDGGIGGDGEVVVIRSGSGSGATLMLLTVAKKNDSLICLDLMCIQTFCIIFFATVSCVFGHIHLRPLLRISPLLLISLHSSFPSFLPS